MTHPVRRALVSATVTLALVAVLLLVPDAVRVYATNMMGSLRAPGEPAFVAAHRGDRATAPENTLPAVEAASRAGFEFLEIDVRLSADRVPVLMHDETVDRTTDGTGAIDELTLAQLRALDAGSWFDPAFAGTPIPTFAEFAAVFAGSRQKALIELKGHWTRADLRTVVDAIYLRGVQNRVVFASFSLKTLASLTEVAPAIPRVVIKSGLPEDPVALLQRFGAIALVTTVDALEADATAVERMHAAGLGVLVYTLNTQRRWSEALTLGVDGIITDRPSALDGWIAGTAPGT